MPRDSNALQTLTSVTIKFPLSSLTIDNTRNVEVHLIQRPNNHDVAVLSIPNLNAASVSQQLAYGAPVSFTWTSWRGSETFVGYVYSSKPYTSGSTRGVQVTVLSAGMPMKRKAQRTFTQVTIPQVAARLAEEHGLATDIEDHPRVWSQISQCGNSDWELLRTLAEQIGYSLRVEGVTLQFMSRSRLARYYRGMAPKLMMSDMEALIPGTVRDVLVWKANLSEHQQQGETLARHVVSGYDAATGNMLSLSSAGVDASGRTQAAPIFDNFVMQPINNSSDAAQVVKDAAEANRFAIRAEATLYGNPILAPNRVIYVDGLADNQSGYWSILEARHEIRPGVAYRMDVTLGTEGLGSENFAPNGPTNSGTVLPKTGLLKIPYGTPRLTSGEHGANLAFGVVQVSGGPRWTS